MLIIYFIVKIWSEFCYYWMKIEDKFQSTSSLLGHIEIDFNINQQPNVLLLYTAKKSLI